MVEYVGKHIKRKEDDRMITGQGMYTADIHLENMVEATFIRSTYAHALIQSIDKEEAEKLPGVHAIITAENIKNEVQPFTDFIEFNIPEVIADQFETHIKNLSEELLAEERTRYVGQPVVIVVADNRYVAEDAANLVKIEYEALPAVTNARQALEEETIVIHEQLENNIHSKYSFETDDFEELFKESDHVINTEIKIPRMSANALETRGIVADYNKQLDKLKVWSSTQIPFLIKSYISRTLGMEESKIRVIAPDMGGGFGPKGAVYPEEMLIPYLSMKLNRPVKWVEDRLEHLSSTRQSRDQLHRVKIGFKKDGKIIGLKDEFLLDAGAYNPFVLTCPLNTATHMRGIYDIPNFSIHCKVLLTNKVPNVPMRGAGRPEATFVMDRLVQLVAEYLNMDLADVIFKNMIKPDNMPYKQNMLYRDGNKLIYDYSDFPKGLQQALDMADYDNFREKQQTEKNDGKSIGIGISSSIEGTGVGPFEGGKAWLNKDGKIIIHSGSTPHGQSHETTLAQISADVFNMDPVHITVRAGDTSLLDKGVGTFASRSAVTAGSAVKIASERLKNNMLEIASFLLNESIDNLELKEGQVVSKYNESNKVTLSEIATAVYENQLENVSDKSNISLEETYYFEPSAVTWSTGFHVVIVEVDKATGFVEILRYIVVHDCGQQINPMVVDGQIQGGVAMGIGASMYEEIIYNDSGQLVTGSYMDYLLPTAMEIPTLEISHQEFLSDRNPIGVKGVGESGAISPPAAIANAIIDAVKPLKIELNELPITPEKLFNLIQDAKEK